MKCNVLLNLDIDSENQRPSNINIPQKYPLVTCELILVKLCLGMNQNLVLLAVVLYEQVAEARFAAAVA
ncbi:MAG: hypothetical protein RBG13Loki_3128 [Promethearchaeota archaeon CR_4]|nr:MAG: hypothetical protein RBG13Loki_3128 [Candidatus Lokiarchaeota archaeon CR_4]